MRPRRLAAGLLAVLFTLLAACTTLPVPPASIRMIRQAQYLVPPDGKANIYVVRRTAHPADQALWTVDLDFRGFGTLGGESYLYGWLAPGEHLLALLQDGWVHERVTFRAAAGSSYFFVVSAGLLRLGIERVDERTGRELIRRFALSGDNRFESEPMPPPRAER
jgi:hypothetical protein